MFGRLFAQQERAITVEQMWGPWYGTQATAAGQAVNRLSAMQLLAVYGSVQLIVNEVSTLPIDSDAEWVKQPTPDLNRISWAGQIVMSMLLEGAAYVGVIGRGMLPLDPQTVTPTRVNGSKRWLINGRPAPFEIIEIPCLMFPGAEKGLSPIEFARHSVGLGLAAQEYGGNFFGAGEGDMPGVIELAGSATPDAMRELAQQWRRKRSKGGRGLPGVLEGGATWKPTGITNEQAQFLATRQFTAAEIAGQMFMVDPSELGIPVQGTSLTYGNLAQRNTRRITFTCMPYIRRIETALAPYARDFRFDVDARLRGDTKTSYETLAIALTAGFMTVNEVREILGLSLLPETSPNDPTQQLAKAQLLGLLKEAPNAAAAA